MGGGFGGHLKQGAGGLFETYPSVPKSLGYMFGIYTMARIDTI